MKKSWLALTITLSLLLALAFPGWAATYYVNPAIGDDAYAGTQATVSGGNGPFKNLPYAAALATTGDTVNITAPATVPCRGGLSPSAAGVIFQGPSATVRAYVQNTLDVSHGQTLENYFLNGSLDAWLSSSTPWTWTPSTGITRETTIVQTAGGSAAKFMNTGPTPVLYSSPIFLPGNTSVTLSFGHYETADDYRFRFQIHELLTDKYLQTDKVTWATGGADVDSGLGANSKGTWATSSISFTTNGSGIYTIAPLLDYPTTSYLENISITLDTPTTYTWADVGGKNYKLLSPLLAYPNIYTFAKGTNEAWAASGLEGLSYVTKAADLATCDATPGSWWWDNTNFALYYNPAVGETITDLHIEVGILRTDDPYNGYDTIYINQTSTILNNLKTMFSNAGGVTAKAASFLFNYVDSEHPGGECFFAYANGTMNHCSGKYSHIEDIFDTTGPGVVVTYNYCNASYATDDGFQALLGSKMVCNYCISHHNGLEHAADNTGFSCEGVGCAFTLYNCVAYANAGYGIEQQVTSGACIAKNNIAWGNNTSGAKGQTDVFGAGADLTASNNCYATQTNWSVSNDITSDPKFVDGAKGDFRLLPGSPCINAGVDVGLTLDYGGFKVPSGPFPDIGVWEYQFKGAVAAISLLLLSD